MLIRMLETRRGSEDGFIVRCFEKHHCYDVADMLARSMIRAGWAAECHPQDTTNHTIHFQGVLHGDHK
jgi:hypothetical protein